MALIIHSKIGNDVFPIPLNFNVKIDPVLLSAAKNLLGGAVTDWDVDSSLRSAGQG